MVLQVLEEARERGDEGRALVLLQDLTDGWRAQTADEIETEVRTIVVAAVCQEVVAVQEVHVTSRQRQPRFHGATSKDN